MFHSEKKAGYVWLFEKKKENWIHWTDGGRLEVAGEIANRERESKQTPTTKLWPWLHIMIYCSRFVVGTYENNYNNDWLRRSNQRVLF